VSNAGVREPSSGAVRVNGVHPRPFYYLENFQTALTWLQRRYDDLLVPDERAFIATLATLPTASSALLVRMIMRKGDLFRTSKLQYAEIGCARQAAAPLIELGWLDDRPLLGLNEVFSILRKSELVQAVRLPAATMGLRKADVLRVAQGDLRESRELAAWCPEMPDGVYRVRVRALCERLRLMFFGNFYQDWSEFVLADLGIFQYEKVPLAEHSRAFHTRSHIEDLDALYRCRQRFHNDEPLEQMLADMPRPIADNDWLEGRRAKLLFQIAQRYEKAGELTRALEMYSSGTHPGSRLRAIRVLERLERSAEALKLAMHAERAPEDGIERQRIQPTLRRLQRRLQMPVTANHRRGPRQTFELCVPRPEAPTSVERVAAAHLARAEAPVHYVENALMNSLFGLLCWEAIFAPLPGAFFHEFHAAPADLFSPDFQRRRERELAACLAQLDSDRYVDTILRTFERKNGIQSVFVAWGLLTEELLRLALTCMPGAHLRRGFEYMLQDLQANRSGLPDLIQFWPGEKRYRLIEVKGPGDRLQHNQIRWLDHCVAHGIPVSVCQVRWDDAAA